MTDCKAYQASDQMICPCGLQWDVNDPEPPQCKTKRIAQIKNHIKGIEMSGRITGREGEQHRNLINELKALER